MSNDFNPVFEALQLLAHAGYTRHVEYDCDGKPVIIVQDPVRGHASGAYGLDGYNEVKLYGSVGESILRCAVRFIEERN